MTYFGRWRSALGHRRVEMHVVPCLASSNGRVWPSQLTFNSSSSPVAVRNRRWLTSSFSGQCYQWRAGWGFSSINTHNSFWGDFNGNKTGKACLLHFGGAGERWNPIMMSLVAGNHLPIAYPFWHMEMKDKRFAKQHLWCSRGNLSSAGKVWMSQQCQGILSYD